MGPGEFYAQAREAYWNLMLLGRRKPTSLLKSQPKRLYRSLAKFRRLQPESLKTGKAVGLGKGAVHHKHSPRLSTKETLT